MILSLLQAATPTDFGLTIESVLARQIPARTRSLIRVDPVEYELIQGTLKPEAPWEKRPITGWKAAPSGYVWFRINSPRKQILQLNINGASMAYVNGEPRVGDVYGYGAYFIPVAMNKGMNDILVYGFRGDATLNWRKPEAEIDLDRFDATLPDFNSDTRKAQGMWGGFVVHNNSERPRTVWLKADGNGASEKRLIPPLGTIKVPTPIPASSAAILVTLREGQNVWATKTFKLQPRKTGEPYRRTFISEMDGSAQYYAVNPSSKPNPKVCVLSLHGASVEAIGQAQAYGQKDFCDIICPTNRRPFGFNWEGIGRKDALEVLADAQSKAKYDPARIMLTGHSMGGHGTWHLGANYPNLFAAIAPCAGWISFDTYAGGANYDLKDPVQKLLARGNNPSDPLLLKENFSQYQSVYIHHGGADDNVPVTEAQHMRDALKGIANVTYSEVPGQGHWFDIDPAPGADSVDWKPFFDIFRTARKTDAVAKGSIDFRAVDMDINRDFGIGQVFEQLHPMELTRVRATRADDRWTISTENVRVISLTPAAREVEVDGQELEPGRVWELLKGKWVEAREQKPLSHGMTYAYRNGFKLFFNPNDERDVKGLCWRKARFDQEQLWYRANATPDIALMGIAPPPKNCLWYSANGRDSRASRGSRAYFTVDNGTVSLGGNDKEGWLLAERFPIFSPGIAYPDFIEVDTTMLETGANGVRTASYHGYFDGGEGVYRDKN